jgi:hypothetical protein
MSSLARRLAVAVILAVAGGTCTSGAAAEPTTTERAPPRLSLIQGEVSFWRPGAAEWAPAEVNTPLTPGDELDVGHRGNLELQIGARAFVRAWGDTQLSLVDAEPHVLRTRVTTGHVSIDLRGIDAGRTVEVHTTGAAFAIAQPGYYRIDVTPQRTTFITRRSGRATMTLPDGQTTTIAADEAVVLDGPPSPRLQRYAAPETDAWDRWNEARTNELVNAVSARYVPDHVYGVADLDSHGDWRVVPTYNAVWIPRGVPVGWAPYSTGKWVLDPVYGWTWVDTAPWGWAPFHYGRWVSIDGRWAWAPGRRVARPVYAPALVAFLGPPAHVGGPFVSWVALGWGEPVVRWWGRSGVIGRPAWLGWGGPRFVNNVVVDRRTVINVNHITVFRNQRVRDAIVAVRRDDFARRRVAEARVGRFDARGLRPLRTPLRIDAEAPSATTTGLTTDPARREVTTRPAAATVTPSATVPSSRMTPSPTTEKAKSASPRTSSDPNARERPRAGERANSTEHPRAVERPRVNERPSPIERSNVIERPRAIERPHRASSSPRAAAPVTPVHPTSTIQRAAPPANRPVLGRHQASQDRAPRAERRAPQRESERGHRPGVRR